MARFFLEKNTLDPQIRLTGDERHHLVNVYRAVPGMEVELFDPDGNEYKAVVVSCSKHEVKLDVLSRTMSSVSSRFKIHLAQGLLKSKCWDTVLQKAMEMGLHAIHPVITQHAAIGEKTAGKEERWQKILIASAKQCGRYDLLKIERPRSFLSLLEETRGIPLRLMAHRQEALPFFKEVMDAHAYGISEVLVLVGPEGGFSEQEISLAGNHGVHAFTMGPHTLRAETAAIAVIANLQFYFQPLRGNRHEAMPL